MSVVSSELQTVNPQGYLLPNRFVYGGVQYSTPSFYVSDQSRPSIFAEREQPEHLQKEIYLIPFNVLVNIYMKNAWSNSDVFRSQCLNAAARISVPMLSYYIVQRLNINVKQKCIIGMVAAAVCAAWACKKICTASSLAEYTLNQRVSFHKDKFKDWLEKDRWVSPFFGLLKPWKEESGNLYKKASESSVQADNMLALEAYLGNKDVVTGSWASPEQTDTDFAQAFQKFDNAYVRRVENRNREEGAVLLAGSAAAAGCLSLLMTENSRLAK